MIHSDSVFHINIAEFSVLSVMSCGYNSVIGSEENQKKKRTSEGEKYHGFFFFFFYLKQKISSQKLPASIIMIKEISTAPFIHKKWKHRALYDSNSSTYTPTHAWMIIWKQQLAELTQECAESEAVTQQQFNRPIKNILKNVRKKV